MSWKVANLCAGQRFGSPVRKQIIMFLADKALGGLVAVSAPTIRLEGSEKIPRICRGVPLWAILIRCVMGASRHRICVSRERHRSSITKRPVRVTIVNGRERTDNSLESGESVDNT